jgi:uncharacterized protein YkwD
MFRIVRYVIYFIAIMLCLFYLHTHDANMKNGLDSVFQSIKNIGTTHTNPADEIGGINITGGLTNGANSTSSKDSNIVKAYTSDNSDSTYVPKPTSNISIDGIIYYTNIERRKAGLAPLIKNTKLVTSATVKVDDMFTNQYFEHTSLSGKTAVDLVEKTGYIFQIVGENLALGVFDSNQALVQAWMNSPEHKANILNPKYTEMGASVGIGNYKGQREWLAVQHFAKPAPQCTQINNDIQNNIDVEKTALEAEEIELKKMAAVIEADPPGQTANREYIDGYNQRVAAYNLRLDTLRTTIDAFNITVVLYNTCIKG